MIKLFCSRQYVLKILYNQRSCPQPFWFDPVVRLDRSRCGPRQRCRGHLVQAVAVARTSRVSLLPRSRSSHPRNPPPSPTSKTLFHPILAIAVVTSGFYCLGNEIHPASALLYDAAASWPGFRLFQIRQPPAPHTENCRSSSLMLVPLAADTVAPFGG